MPTTTYLWPTMQVRGIGTRTDNAGAAVSDLSAEELRLPDPGVHTEGALTTGAFALAAGSGMDTVLGSGTSKADQYVVAGEVTGQGKYTVALAQSSLTVTVPAADASQRIDEVYLVVLDAPYDSNTLGTASAPVSRPAIGYRKGDAGGGNPGVDSMWRASVLLSRITVPASATSIVSGNISDQRALAALTLATSEHIRDAIGSALVAGTGITITPDDPGDAIAIVNSAPYPAVGTVAASLSAAGSVSAAQSVTNDGTFRSPATPLVVSLTTGTEVWIDLSAEHYNVGGGASFVYTGVKVTGATTRGASISEGIQEGVMQYAATRSGGVKITGLTPGVNNFEMVHAQAGSNGPTWGLRYMRVTRLN